MNLRKNRYWILGLVALSALVVIGATIASGAGGAKVAPGEIDDGAELLDQATISLADAIASAQAAASGALGEVDLKTYEGQLVFNVDIGDKDVKVDASDGTVLGWVSDDDGDQEEDD